MSELWQLSAGALRQGFLAAEFSPLEAYESVAERIEATKDFNTFISLDLENAHRQATLATEGYERGLAEDRPLLGVPIAVKDLLDVSGLPTTCGSAMLAENRPADDALIVSRFRRAGATIMGKAHMFEFAWGISSDNEDFGRCANPWQTERIAGGSSSGSAVAAALRQVPIAIGSDTAGSIRIPAAFCGVAGLRPTGACREPAGVFPLAPSLDQIGPISRDPADLALAMEVSDPGWSREALRAWRQRFADRGLRGLRIAYWSRVDSVPPREDIAATLDSAADLLRQLGAEVDRIENLDIEDVLDYFPVIQSAEAQDVHRRRDLYPARRDAYARALAERLERAGSITLTEYFDAIDRRRRLAERMHDVFRDYDLIASPVSPITPPEFGEEDRVAVGEARDLRGAVLKYTVPQALAGLPCCSVNAGFDDAGMPVGLQLAGPPGGDVELLAVAERYWLEASVSWPSGPDIERQDRLESEDRRMQWHHD